MEHSALPLVSICMSSYNNALFVEKTLESFKQQTYKNIELIIVDDCSKDNSVQLIDDWLAANSIPHVFVKNEVNKGIATVANLLINNARGKYFCIIASDDVMLPDKTTAQVQLMENNPDVGMVYGDCMVIDEHGAEVQPSLFDDFFGKSFSPPSGNLFQPVVKEFLFYLQACLLNLSMLRQTNFAFDMALMSEDWDIELTMARHFRVLGERTIYTQYRKLSTSVTALNWTDEKKHLVQKSHFAMFNKYLRDPKNSGEDFQAIIMQMRNIYWEFYFSRNSQRADKVAMYQVIWENTKSLKDALLFRAILLGLSPLLKAYVSYTKRA